MKVVELEELKAGYDSGTFMIVDVRSDLEYDVIRVKGSYQPYRPVKSRVCWKWKVALLQCLKSRNTDSGISSMSFVSSFTETGMREKNVCVYQRVRRIYQQEDMDRRSELKLQFVDLGRIYNKNEKRVVLAMEKYLPTVTDWEPEALDVQDIYALSLNSLPPRYVQDGTIVFNEPVKLTDIEHAVQVAVNKVRNAPTVEKE